MEGTNGIGLFLEEESIDGVMLYGKEGIEHR